MKTLLTIVSAMLLTACATSTDTERQTAANTASSANTRVYCESDIRQSGATDVASAIQRSAPSQECSE